MKFLFLLLLLWGGSVGGLELTYVWGDALQDKGALGPGGQPYPWEFASKIAKRRLPRSLEVEEMTLLTPEETRTALLRAFETPHPKGVVRKGRSEGDVQAPYHKEGGGCVPTRLCETTYNTTAPMYGISLTSGKPVTIVQKFPDLLQQVVYQVCKSEDCDVIQGQCVQTYLPYLFLVIPLGPVTLTGQDYVLVESGCACKPKYAKRQDEQPQLPFIQPFNSTNKPRSNKRF